MKLSEKIVRLLTLLLAVMSLSGCAKSVEDQIAEQLQLGQKYLTEVKYEEAIAAFNKVLELEPKQLEAYTGLATAYTQTGKTAELEKTYEDGFNVISENSDTVDQTLAWAFLTQVSDYQIGKEDYESAVQTLQLLQQFAVDDAAKQEVLDMLTEVYLKMGDRDSLDNLIDTEEENSTELQNLAACLELVDQVQEYCAAGSYREAYELVNSGELAGYHDMISDLQNPITLSDGKGVGIYALNGKGYLPDRYGIYYGDYQEGVRSGEGIWITYAQDYDLIYAEGEWSGDAPNGYQMQFSYCVNDTPDQDQEGWEKLSGTVKNGLWDGTVSYEDSWDPEVCLGNCRDGKWDLLVDEDDGRLCMLIGEDGYSYVVWDDATCYAGIEGFY